MRPLSPLLLLVLLLTACATPPGKLTDSDFTSRTVTLDTSIPASLDNMHQGFRFCGPESGGLIFVTLHGSPVCLPARQDGFVLCDVYVGSRARPSDFVLGRIELSPTLAGTSAVLRVQTWAHGTDDVLRSWEMFLRGRGKEVCPAVDSGQPSTVNSPH